MQEEHVPVLFYIRYLNVFLNGIYKLRTRNLNSTAKKFILCEQR